MTSDVNVVISHSEYTVLVVDDVVSNVLLLKVLSTNEKFKVITAGNGKEALSQAVNARPDLILLDVMMPEMNGLEATRCIRAFEGKGPGEGTPIIAMTANVFADDVRAGLDAGMNSHVGKPLDMKVLIGEILKYTDVR